MVGNLTRLKKHNRIADDSSYNAVSRALGAEPWCGFGRSKVILRFRTTFVLVTSTMPSGHLVGRTTSWWFQAWSFGPAA